MKRLCSLLLFLPLLCFSQQITIQVTLTGTPANTTKLQFAKLKYNKWSRFGMTFDDMPATAIDFAAYYTGGTTIGGTTYPGHTFTDGANVRSKNIPWAADVAANAFWNTDTTASGWGLTINSLTKIQMKSLIDRGWALLDHGAFHESTQPGGVALGLNPFKNAAFNRNYQYRQMASVGAEYVMRVGVVPTAEAGYQSAWEQLGYLGGSSQSVDDKYPDTYPDWLNYGIVNVSNWLKDNRYKVHLRRFVDPSAEPYGSATRWIEGVKDGLIAQQNSTTPLSLQQGAHGADFDTLKKGIDLFAPLTNDHVWFCSMQEFYEYFEVAQQSNVKQTLSGNTLTVVIDQSFLKDEVRWRDMSFLLSSNSSISSVTVTGADDWSYNTTTGLINIYKKKTTGFETPPYYNNTGFVFNQKINIQKDDIFCDNDVAEYYNTDLGRIVDYGQLIDGNTSERYYAKPADRPMIYSPFDITFDLGDYGAVVHKVRIYAAGSGFTTQVILTRNDNGADSLIGTYTGGSGWIEFNTSTYKFVAGSVILRSNSSSGYGNEVEIYADHKPYTEQVYPHRQAKLGYMFGVNSYAWDFVDVWNSNLDPGKEAAFNSLKLQSIRNYVDVDFVQRDMGATYSFDPIRTGHREDDVFRALKTANPKMIRWSVMQGQGEGVKQSWRNNPNENNKIIGNITAYQDMGAYGLLTLNVTSTAGAGAGPLWWRIDNTSRAAPTQFMEGVQVFIPTSLPASVSFYIGPGIASSFQVGDVVSAKEIYHSNLNIPYQYNSIAGRASLAAYDSSARLAYVYSARKGRNPNATPFVASPSTDGAVGVNTSEWAELMNEPNAWWGGYDDFLNGKSLAYAWSKIYDNNKVYSTTLGVKNADTSMKVSHSGLAINTVDLNRGADFTTRYLRGNRPKSNVPVQPTDWRSKTFGWVDNAYDIIQFHNYSYTGGANQFGPGVNSGIPLEISPALQGVKDFVWFRNKYTPWALVDVGEWGYDIHQGSPMNAPAIGSKSIDQVRAAWSIRTPLMYNVVGVDVAQWYRLYSYDSVSVQFSTMSLLRYDGSGNYSRRLVGDWMAQMSEFSEYWYDGSLRDDTVKVFRFTDGTKYMYAIWGVEKFENYTQSYLLNNEKAVFTERTGTYNLSIPDGTPIQVKQLQPGTTEMSTSNVTTFGTDYPVTYDLIPKFIVTNISVEGEEPPPSEPSDKLRIPKGRKLIFKQ